MTPSMTQWGFSRVSETDLEALAGRGAVTIVLLDVGDAGAGRAAPHLIEERGEALVVADGFQLDAAVGEVADPAGQAETLRHAERVGAEAHAVHLAGDVAMK